MMHADALQHRAMAEPVDDMPGTAEADDVLSGKYQGGATPEGARFSRYLAMEGRQAAMGRRFVNEKTLAATERYLKIAEEAGLHPVTMATAWSKQHDFVASTIVGVSADDQVQPILDALDLVLSDDVMSALHKVSKDILYPMG